MNVFRLACLAPLLVAACATRPPVPAGLQDCAQWYEDLDARVAAQGVRDAQARPVEGFPYLRVNRLLAALRDEAAADVRKRDALVVRMQSLDAAARGVELANLGAALDEARARDCGDRLRVAHLEDAEAAARLLERATVPDDYSSVSRFFGLYALTKYPFFSGVSQYQADVRASFAAGLAGRPARRYAPPAAPPFARSAQAEALARGAADPLGIPEPQGETLERLFAAHAPVFEVEQTGEFDFPGALHWPRSASMPAVDPSDVAVYRMASWTRYRGRVLLQLVYTIWFAERPPASSPDLLAGKLDGVTWRVTLAPDGEPLVYDTMHPCGCYHMFFPTPRAQPVEAPEAVLEWMFSPQPLRRVAEGERPVLRIATRTHYVERVTLVRDVGAGARYALRPYDELRSLPRPEGGRASAFGQDGLVAGTERAERWLFWPMGIDSAGAMRQWGRHATAFVGRRHFDDADLLEKRFVLQLP
ncbi:MAG: hypothetical protein OEV81_15740 [Betaproteobacteria bacterium]|nr:hypothetical protein [Betaproteobacteria bacterium]MDH5350426.1 hypothetical protein [Betaproteobacteria bacterium]